MKLVLIAGTRPEYIQIEPIYGEAVSNGIETILINTGQHYDYEMSQIFFKELELPDPHYNLNVKSGPQGKQTGYILIRLEKILLKEKPDICLVSGDTNSGLAGGLVASKLHMTLAHNESGMRSYNRYMPEEINRVILDHISDIRYISVPSVKNILAKEGISENVIQVGDVMYDSYLKIESKIKKNKNILNKLSLKNEKYNVLTLHRAENVDNKVKLKKIIGALSSIDHKIIFPIHPRTKKRLKEFKIVVGKNIRLIEPLGYFEFLTLLYNSSKILTDSGGVQKQAYFMKKPCLTLRTETEWTDTVKAGCNRLVMDDKNKIIKEIDDFNPNISKYKNIFGTGKAANKIIKNLKILRS